MEIGVDAKKDILILQPKGSLDFQNVNTFEKTFLNSKKEFKNFAIMCEEISFIDSSGMGILVKILSHARQRNGKMFLVGLQHDVESILSKADLLFFFQTLTKRDFNRKFPGNEDDFPTFL